MPDLSFLAEAGLSPAHRAELDAAAGMAARAHAGQRRAHGVPYIEHPVAVLRILVDEMSVCDRDVTIAALLHDVVEDSELTVADIDAAFGAEVAAIVAAVTKDASLPRDQRDRETVAKLALAGVPATLVKLADRLHNLRDARHHPDPGFRRRYVAAAERHYLPLAETMGPGWARAYRDAMSAALG